MEITPLLLSAMDFRDKSRRREEQFSCPQSEQIGLSLDAAIEILLLFFIIMVQPLVSCVVSRGVRRVLVRRAVLPSVSSSGNARLRLFLFLLTQQIGGGFFLHTSILHIRALGIDQKGQR